MSGRSLGRSTCKFSTDGVEKLCNLKSASEFWNSVPLNDQITNVAILGDLVAVQGQDVLVCRKGGCRSTNQQYGNGFR